MKFIFRLFCRNRNLMVPRACNTRFLKIVFDSAETFKHFLVCSASDEMHSAYAQPAMKFVPRMLSIFWMMFWNGYWTMFFPLSPSAVACLPSFVSCLKCLFLVSHPLFHFSRLCSLFPVHCSLSQVSVPCLTSLFLISRPLSPLLCTLSPVLCSMSQFSVPCLPSSVPCLTSLYLVSRPLFPVSVSHLCSFSSILCSMSHYFVPCLLSPVPCLTSLFLVSRPLFPILRLCSLSPILFSQS